MDAVGKLQKGTRKLHCPGIDVHGATRKQAAASTMKGQEEAKKGRNEPDH